MNYIPRNTEEAFRHNLPGYLDDIQGYANPTNDGHLAAWMTLRSRIEAMLADSNTVIRAIANRPARPVLGPGQEALRLIAAEPLPADMIQTATPEEEEALDAIERKQLHPVFAQLLEPFAPKREAV